MDLRQNKPPVRNALGRGLSALISTPPVSVIQGAGNAAPLLGSHDAAGVERAQASDADMLHADKLAVLNDRVHFLPIDKIIANPTQPRQSISEIELKELSDSIKAHGVLQPVLVRPAREPVESGVYEIVAGERRWRAAKLVGLHQLPVIIHKISDREAVEIALIENVQREDLNPLEQARAYQRLSEEFSLSQEEIAEKVGKDRASIANFLRLLKLPHEVQSLLESGALSTGHAKAILTIKEPSAQISLAKKTVREGLSVRALEAIVARVVVLDSGRRSFKNRGEAPGGGMKATAFPEVVDRMRNVLGTKVTIKHCKSGRGRIEIEYFSEQELDRLVEQIIGG